jgi:hypothetical protein
LLLCAAFWKEIIMTELVDRYVHQVGRYLPPKERAEIEAELRSQIQDQLDDRYAGSPSPEDVATVLAEFGHPYRMAAAYGGERYLVGPDLYPYMMTVLRRGWLLVPAIVVFVTVFGALVSSEQSTLIGLVIGSLLGALQAILIFSAVVVLFFAILQHSGTQVDEQKQVFNPLELPAVDDPGSVDRFEAASGIAIGIFVTLVVLYWLRVGGLTLRFNLSDPGEVLPSPTLWLFLLAIVGSAMIILHLWALRRNRWSVGLWLAQSMLELVGAICMYFAVYQPFFQRLLATAPGLSNVPGLDRSPEIITLVTAVIMLVGNGNKLIRLWNYRNNSVSSFSVKADA